MKLPLAVAGLALALALALAPGLAGADGPLLVQPAGPGDLPPPPWKMVGLPQPNRAITQFYAATLDGQRVLRVEAQAAYGNLVHPLQGKAGAHRLSWRWRLDQPLLGADLRRKDGDDSPIKVCALFDLATSAVPFIERQVLRIARLRTGESLPAATVCYVWDARLAAGTVLDNVYSRRVRMVVLRGPESALDTWLSEQRDVSADFKRLFGDESAAVPPLVGIAIGADTDNTQARSLAYVGSIALE